MEAAIEFVEHIAFTILPATYFTSNSFLKEILKF